MALTHDRIAALAKQAGSLLYPPPFSWLLCYARAVEAAATPNEWQPIETAPLDGTSVLGYWLGGKHDCAIHATKFWNGRWWEPNEDYPQSEPTHWMPLPPPARQQET